MLDEETNAGGRDSSVFWRSLPMSRMFDNETIAELASISSFRRWPPQTVLFQRGDDGNYLIGLAAGRIKLSLVTLQGRELTLRQIEAGELFGEMAMLDEEPRSADATTLVASEGFVVLKKAFAEFISRSPRAAEGIIRHLCSRLRDTTEQLETVALYDLNARVARFFLSTIRQLHGSELPETIQLKLALNQSEIAEILGASRPKVNRALLALERAGGIKRIHGLTECNVLRLRRIADPIDQ